MNNWDLRFLQMAKLVSTWSKDPSTKCGAVIVEPASKKVISIGYNGFPRGIKDDERLQNREQKYSLIIHAEINAIMQAQTDLYGCVLYTYPFICCNRCAVHVIQAGILRVVAPNFVGDAKRWEESFNLSRSLFTESFVRVSELDVKL
jgi:dCMP deaminase